MVGGGKGREGNRELVFYITGIFAVVVILRQVPLAGLELSKLSASDSRM